ncbi:MAG: hypothetical protein S4CHLAM81_06820 [Chlamydiales bacterium]|nr:hypothetical protein [Chlamydiales bacterium]MCH9635466.1 hypothetical protein [Chlamydiales bacterium]
MSAIDYPHLFSTSGIELNETNVCSTPFMRCASWQLDGEPREIGKILKKLDMRGHLRVDYTITTAPFCMMKPSEKVSALLNRIVEYATKVGLVKSEAMDHFTVRAFRPDHDYNARVVEEVFQIFGKTVTTTLQPKGCYQDIDIKPLTL